MLQVSEQNARNAHTIDYNERNPFTVCCLSLTPIYKGSPLVRSAFCNAAYKPEFKVCHLSYDVSASDCAHVQYVQGQVCSIDMMSLIGEETLGLVTLQSSSRK